LPYLLIDCHTCSRNGGMTFLHTWAALSVGSESFAPKGAHLFTKTLTTAAGRGYDLTPLRG
jgi:hypothetical protein